MPGPIAGYTPRGLAFREVRDSKKRRFYKRF